MARQSLHLDRAAQRLHARRHRRCAFRCCCRRASIRRLRSATRASSTTFFPDWEDWPATLAERALRGAPTAGTPRRSPATRDDRRRTASTDSCGLADSAVWKALFHRRRHACRRLRLHGPVRSAGALVRHAARWPRLVEQLYSDLARTATDRMPRVSEILEHRALARAHERRGSSSTAVIGGPATPGLRDPNGSSTASAHERAWRPSPDARSASSSSTRRPATPIVRHAARTDDPRIDARWLEYERTELPGARTSPASIDFHQIVAAMGSYPTLLRRLGLVVDLVLAPGDFHAVRGGATSPSRSRFPAGALKVPRSADGAPGHAHAAHRRALRRRARSGRGAFRVARRPARPRPPPVSACSSSTSTARGSS